MLIAVVFLNIWGEARSNLVDEEMWGLARKDLAVGNVSEAWKKLERLLGQYPEEPQLQQVAGLAALKRGDGETALIHVRKAVALAPDDAEALTLLGWLDMEVAGDIDTAIASYRKVASLKPDVPEVHNNLGVALKRKGDTEAAVGSFSRALELQPNFVQAASNRGWAYVWQSDWRAARADFEKTLALQPEDEGALYGLARVRKELRDYSGAQDALAQLSGRSGNFVYWLEWGMIGLIRYYWVFLLLALGLFFYFRFKARKRVNADG